MVLLTNRPQQPPPLPTPTRESAKFESLLFHCSIYPWRLWIGKLVAYFSAFFGSNTRVGEFQSEP